MVQEHLNDTKAILVECDFTVQFVHCLSLHQYKTDMRYTILYYAAKTILYAVQYILVPLAFSQPQLMLLLVAYLSAM